MDLKDNIALLRALSHEKAQKYCLKNYLNPDNTLPEPREAHFPTEDQPMDSKLIGMSD